VTISYERYTRIANKIIHRLRSLEGLDTAETLGTKGEIVEWYLTTEEGNISTEAELNEEKRVAKLVLHRMVEVDGVVLEVSEGLLPDNEDEEMAESQDDDKVLVVHPNYSVEE